MLIRSLLLLVACLVTAQLLLALPLEHDQPETLLSQESEQLPLEAGNEGAAVVRDKRTIGFLRQAFPTLSQIIDRKIQAITRLIFRLVGRLVLRGGGGGGGGGTDSSDEDNERRVQITLPTFPPSEDDDDEEDEDSTGSSDDSTTTTTEPSEDENSLAESQVVVRKARQAPAAAPSAAEEEEYEDEDQAAAATGDNEVAGSSEDTEADDTDSAESENSEDDPRNKRFLNLGGSGGSGGGSGNFLFDIIRRSADRAARMAGTVYRVLAGTDDVGLPTYPPATATLAGIDNGTPTNKHTRAALVAGSGTTQGQDEADNAPLDENSTHSGKADDGYSAGVPGPLTRLFVIANRGIANLIQDLILRLAQTSERIVNFKARLITSII